jgi:hypothetical protein
MVVVVAGPVVVVVGPVVVVVTTGEPTWMTAMSESSSSPVWESTSISDGLVRSIAGSSGLLPGVESLSSPSSAEMNALLTYVARVALSSLTEIRYERF